MCILSPVCVVWVVIVYVSNGRNWSLVAVLLLLTRETTKARQQQPSVDLFRFSAGLAPVTSAVLGACWAG